MLLNQVKFGEVIHNTVTDEYARVVGLRKVGDIIYIEVHYLRKAETDTAPARERTNPEYFVWDPNNCVSQTHREKGDEGEVFYFVPQDFVVEREI
jgi:hypothetical protein